MGNDGEIGEIFRTFAEAFGISFIVYLLYERVICRNNPENDGESDDEEEDEDEESEFSLSEECNKIVEDGNQSSENVHEDVEEEEEVLVETAAIELNSMPNTADKETMTDLEVEEEAKVEDEPSNKDHNPEQEASIPQDENCVEFLRLELKNQQLINETRIESANKKAEELEGQLSDSRIKVEDLQRELAEAKEAVVEKEQSVKLLRKDLMEFVSRFTDEKAAFERLMKERIAFTESLIGSLEQVKRRNETLLAELEECRADCRRKSKAKKKAEKKVFKLTETVDEIMRLHGRAIEMTKMLDVIDNID